MVLSLLRQEWKPLFYILSGSLIYSAGFNLFILPCDLYSGGFLGLAQLLLKGLHAAIPAASSLPLDNGTVYFLLNLPLLVLGYRAFGLPFIIKTIICVGVYSFFLSAIPIPDAPYLPEEVASCIAGGVICGIGAGITLLSKGSGGGEEILGLLLMKKYHSFSIGKLANITNTFIFGACLYLFDLSTTVYSIFFTVIYFVVLDRVHLQNITMTMLIITKKDGMEQLIFDLVHRGCTTMGGIGAYTGEKVHVLLTVVSKEEAMTLRPALAAKDPDVFIIEDESVSIRGNFQKRL